MKKTIVFILILSLIFGSASYSYASGLFSTIGESIDNIIKSIGETIQELIKLTVNKFKDVKATDWFIKTVSKLVGIGGIDGYPDGTFKPNNPITKAEFTKILVSTLGFNNPTKTGTHWASGYISKAEEIKLIGKGELKNVDNAISRNEMAKMCANALDFLGESHVEDRELYKGLIKDYDKIPDEYKDYVLKAYAKGIISGYPDGTFKGSQGLTRAEASSVVIRVIDESERVVPEKPQMPTDFGPHVDLRKVPIIGDGKVEIRVEGDYNPYNLDFSYMARTYKPMEAQYTDMENLLSARFGKDNSTVKEIMKYIKSSNNLPLKEWNINGQLIMVDSLVGSQVINLQVWRAK